MQISVLFPSIIFALESRYRVMRSILHFSSTLPPLEVDGIYLYSPPFIRILYYVTEALLHWVKLCTNDEENVSAILIPRTLHCANASQKIEHRTLNQVESGTVLRWYLIKHSTHWGHAINSVVYNGSSLVLLYFLEYIFEMRKPVWKFVSLSIA